MSQELHLITRQRPATSAFTEILAAAAPGQDTPSIDGDFADPDAYLNISAPGLWIELEAPGHIEHADAQEIYHDTTTLPEPDEQGCLWLTTASIPNSAPPPSKDVAWQLLRELAARFEGMTVEP